MPKCAARCCYVPSQIIYFTTLLAHQKLVERLKIKRLWNIKLANKHFWQIQCTFYSSIISILPNRIFLKRQIRRCLLVCVIESPFLSLWKKHFCLFLEARIGFSQLCKSKDLENTENILLWFLSSKIGAIMSSCHWSAMLGDHSSSFKLNVSIISAHFQAL